jgi:hypothetical protein
LANIKSSSAPRITRIVADQNQNPSKTKEGNPH